MEQIRKYHPKDKGQLATLIQLEMGFGENELKFLTEKCEVLIVYENNDKLIGFSFFRTLENHTQTGNCYTYVTPSMRNQGIGSKLHTEIFDIAKEAGIMHFATRIVTDGESELDFYKKRGYRNWYALIDMKRDAQPAENPGVTMLPYSDDYFEAYAKGEREAFYEMRKHHNFIPYYACEVNEETKKEFHDDLTGNTYVLTDSDEFLGAVTVTDQGYIDDLFVAPEHQGNGIGRKLILFAINKARDNGAQSIKLDVVKWNTRAANLYRSVGFGITHTKNFYMLDEE